MEQDSAFPVSIGLGGTGATTSSQAQFNLRIIDDKTTELRSIIGNDGHPYFTWAYKDGREARLMTSSKGIYLQMKAAGASTFTTIWNLEK